MFLLDPLFFSSSEGRMRTSSSEYKLIKVILHIGCPSYRLTSQRKPVLIQRHSAQIPKAFIQHGIAEIKNYLGIDALT